MTRSPLSLRTVVLTNIEMLGMLRAERRFEEERCLLYRSYFDTFVTHVSPILLDAAAVWGLDVAAALRTIRAPANWPMRWRSRPPLNRFDVLESCRAGNVVEFVVGAKRWGRMPAVATADHSRSALLHVEARTLQSTILLGDAICFGEAKAIEVWVPGPFPETLATAAIGRPLVDVVEHELFALHDYRISNVLTGSAEWTKFVADAPAVPKPRDWSARG